MVQLEGILTSILMEDIAGLIQDLESPGLKFTVIYLKCNTIRKMWGVLESRGVDVFEELEVKGIHLPREVIECK